MGYRKEKRLSKHGKRKEKWLVNILGGKKKGYYGYWKSNFSIL
jgi:hypothetical protein